MTTCDGCHETFSEQEARCKLNFDLCDPCHRKLGDVPVLRLPFTYHCFTSEREGGWVETHECDGCLKMIRGRRCWTYDYDLCTSCFACLPRKEMRRFMETLVLVDSRDVEGGAGFTCDGCGTGPSQQGYCPIFVGCQSCINRPGMMSFATRGLTCGLLPHMGRFYRGQSTEGGGRCDMCRSTSSCLADGSYLLNYSLCQACKENPPEAVEGHIKSLFRYSIGGHKLLDCTDLMERKILGRGTFGKVVLVERPGCGAQYALKLIDLSPEPELQRCALLEAQMMLECRHPHIIDCIRAFQHDGQLHIVMELAQHGDLSSLLRVFKQNRRRMDTEVVFDMLYQLMLGLEHLHMRNIVHRDIKPQNILVFHRKKRLLKIGDLGIAKVLEGSYATSCGTPMYMAPEMIEQGVAGSPASDIWAAGCIAFEMCELHHPFYPDNRRTTQLQALRKMKESVYNVPERRQPLQSLIRWMLEPHPHDRPTAAQVIQECRAPKQYQPGRQMRSLAMEE